jgi:hypothetical protein
MYRARVEPNEIGYLVSLVEAHEGLAVVRTKDAALGIVEFWISPLMRQDFESLLEALKQELGIRAEPPQIMDIQKLESAAGEVIRPAANRNSID